MLNNIDTNINTVNEKIDTIFYFVETLTYDEYMEMCQKGQIEMRTIVFAKQQRAIYKGGDMYCPMEDDTFLSILLRMFDEEDVINALINFIKNHRGDLPIATKELLGVIMVGTTLAITEQGVLDVDFDNSDVINKIKNIIKNWFEYPDQNLPKASKEKFGIVKIGDGIKVQDGLISVDLGNPDGPGEDGSLINQIIKAVYNWFQENSSTAHAGYTRYGVVKIKPNSGIKAEDGVIEIDPSTMPSSLDQSIVSMTATKIGDQHNIVIRQNNNGNSPLSVDITSLVQNIIDNTGGGSGSGDSSKIKIRINSTNFHWEVSYDDGVTWEDLGVVAKGQDGRDGQDGQDGQDGKDGQDGQDGKDGQDGSSGTNSTEIISIIKTSDDLIDELLKRIKALELAQQTGSTIQINNAITEIIKAINENNWNEIFHSSGWSNAMLAYLQDVGIITQWTDENGVITTTLNTTSILQNTNFITAVARQVETQNNPDGVLDKVLALESELEIGTADRLAYATLKAALSDWDTSKPTISSALSTTTNRVENTEQGLVAIAGQSASVISDYAFTVAQLGLNADPTGSLADLVSSFGQYVYTTDKNGNEVPVYEVDNNGNALYQLDSEGHMLPYTGFLLKYLDANGNVTDTPTVQCTTEKIRLDGNNNPVLDSEGNPIYDTVPVYEKDGVTPIYRQVAIKVWYTGDYSGDYQGTDYYITSDDIYFNSDGSTQWELYGTQNGQAIYKIKQKSGSMIAYHKVRKMRISSSAGFITHSDLDNAVTTAFADYESAHGSSTYATTTQLASETLAGITSIAKMSIYEYETDANGKVVRDSNGDIKFKWHKDNETDVYSATSPGTGWEKVIKSENQSGLIQLVTKDSSLASMFVEYDDYNAFVEAIADKSGSTVTIKGDKIDFNTTAINAIKANLTVDKLQAGTTNVVKVNGDDGVAIFTGGVNNSPTTWLKPDGSGYIAKGSIAWDNNTLTSNDSVKMTMYTDGIEVSGRASSSPVSKATITNESIQIVPQGTQLGNTVTMNGSNGFKISGKSGTSIVGAGSINITGSSAGITMTGNSPSIRMNDETGFTGLISVDGRTLKFVGGILVSATATS